MYPQSPAQGNEPEQIPTYSYAPHGIDYQSDTEFLQIAESLNINELVQVMDELMSTLQIVQPRLYAGVIRKIKSLAP